MFPARNIPGMHGVGFSGFHSTSSSASLLPNFDKDFNKKLAELHKQNEPRRPKELDDIEKLSFVEYARVRSADIAASLQPEHMLMGAMVHAVYQAYKDKGIDLDHFIDRPDQLPDDLEDALKEAFRRTLDTDEPGVEDMLRPKESEKDWLPYPEIKKAYLLDAFSPLVKETLKLLQDPRFDQTPFSQIPRKQRWITCMDFRTLSLMENSTDPSKFKNILNAFVYDNEKSYALGMAKGHLRSMTQKGDLVKLILDLQKDCSPQVQRLGFADEDMGSFEMYEGRSLTDRGREELKEFAREVREVIPVYMLGVLPEALDNFLDKKKKAPTPDQLDKVPLDAKRNPIITVLRGDYKPGMIEYLVRKWIKEYEESPKSTEDENITRIAKLAQKLVYLHGLLDSNARVFEVFIVNHLLKENGLDLCLLDEANGLEGMAVDEAAQKIKEGQARLKTLGQEGRSSPGSSQSHLMRLGLSDYANK